MQCGVCTSTQEQQVTQAECLQIPLSLHSMVRGVPALPTTWVGGGLSPGPYSSNKGSLKTTSGWCQESLPHNQNGHTSPWSRGQGGQVSLHCRWAHLGRQDSLETCHLEILLGSQKGGLKPETYSCLASLRHGPLKARLGCAQARRGFQSHTLAHIGSHAG